MPNPDSKVNFYCILKKPFLLPKKRKLKLFIEDIFKKERTPLYRLDYIFCTDNYLLKINRQFLSHDLYTDIITFNLSESSKITGEIYISIDRVRQNAKTFNTSFQSEVHRIMFHGVLHLCGYKDKLISDKKLITKKEDHYLKEYKNCST